MVAGYLVPYVMSVRGLRAGEFPDLDLIVGVYRSGQPSLQALRAETKVERFTARIHVVLQPGRRSGQNDEQKVREKSRFA